MDDKTGKSEYGVGGGGTDMGPPTGGPPWGVEGTGDRVDPKGLPSGMITRFRPSGVKSPSTRDSPENEIEVLSTP